MILNEWISRFDNEEAGRLTQEEQLEIKSMLIELRWRRNEMNDFTERKIELKRGLKRITIRMADNGIGGLTMNAERLEKIIESHKKWLAGEDGEKADLSGANLCGADLYRAVLLGANLSGADLYGARLSRANLYGANLSEADLYGANLYRANLSRANLSRADLSRADLSEADLSKANLYGANLGRANLYGANLGRAQLPEKIIQVGPIGSRKDYTIYWVDRNIVQCGCWNNYDGGSLEDFKKRIDKVYPEGQYRKEYLALIAIFEALRRADDD